MRSRLSLTLVFACLTPVAQTLPKTQIANEVRTVIESAVAQETFVTKDGIPVTTRVPISQKSIEQIRKLGKAAIPILSDYSRSPDSQTQRVAVELLGYVGGKDSVQPLAEVLLRSKSVPNRLVALGWLSQMPSAEVRGIIGKVQYDPQPSVRNKAQEVLHMMGPTAKD